MNHVDAVRGALLGCAIGDALGLPYESLSKRRGVRLLGEPARHRFVFGRGMVSDDTEHTIMVAQALCAAPDDPERFARELARQLRWWLLGCPAGIGYATLRAILKSWIGFGPTNSGVFSAGNGPAMRSPLLGAAIDDPHRLAQFVRASTILTHTDPKAYHGALATAVAAWCAKRGIDSPARFLQEYERCCGVDSTEEWNSLLSQMATSVDAGGSTEHFAEQIGCGRGVSGYVYRTVPVALHAWLSSPRDYRRAAESVIRCGGDTDTTAAIVGAIVGSGTGRDGIPSAWIDHLWEWPQTVSWMDRLAEATANAIERNVPTSAPRVVPGIRLIRNVIFLVTVFVHIGRRLLPPYG